MTRTSHKPRGEPRSSLAEAGRAAPDGFKPLALPAVAAALCTLSQSRKPTEENAPRLPRDDQSSS
jgi:hypothetical protein